MRRLAVSLFVGLALSPSVAFAEVTVTVLGLRSATADEQIAAQVTSALRQAADAARSAGISHTGRENQLSQLLVVFDCDDTTPRCMREIGRSLSSQRLVYGLVEPESGRSDADYAVTLRYFNVETGEVERDLRELIPRGVNAQGMAERAARFFDALTGVVMRGGLAISCNVRGARVSVGDRDVGTTGDDPLVITDLEPGEVSVVVRSDDYTTFRQDVTIEAGQTQRLSVELQATASEDDGGTETVVSDPRGDEGGTDWTEEPQPRRRSLAWLGWTNIGLAAAFGGLGLWASLHVNNVRGDETLQEYYSDQFDICESEPVDAGLEYTLDEVRDRCRTAETLEALQFVFYGLSAVTFGVGLWLVIREMGRDDDEARRFDVTPIALRDGGAVAASLRF